MTAGIVVTDVLVAGMTCAHCVASVQEELSELPGVESVEVDLVVGGASRVAVRSLGPLEPSDVRAAVAEAGYAVAEEEE